MQPQDNSPSEAPDDSHGVQYPTKSPFNSPAIGLTVTNISHSTEVAGDSCIFSALWHGHLIGGGYIFSTNASGSWVNNSWIPFESSPSWANATAVLNKVMSIAPQPMQYGSIGYLWYVNGTDGVWVSSGDHYILSSKVIDPQPVSGLHPNALYFDDVNNKIWVVTSTTIDGVPSNILYYTTDIGCRNPQWLLVGTLEKGLFYYQFIVNRNETMIYGTARNYTEGLGVSSYYTDLSALTSHNITLVHYTDTWGGATPSLPGCAEDDAGNIYIANYVVTGAKTNRTGIIVKSVNATAFEPFFNCVNQLHVHGISYSETSNRLYWSMDGGGGYLALPSNESIAILDTATMKSKIATAKELPIHGVNEVFLVSDDNNVAVYRYTYDGNLIRNYYLYYDKEQPLFTVVVACGNLLFLRGHQNEYSGIAQVYYIALNLQTGEWRYIMDATSAGEWTNVSHAGVVNDYAYFLVGNSLEMIDLTSITI